MNETEFTKRTNDAIANIDLNIENMKMSFDKKKRFGNAGAIEQMKKTFEEYLIEIRDETEKILTTGTL